MTLHRKITPEYLSISFFAETCLMIVRADHELIPCDWDKCEILTDSQHIRMPEWGGMNTPDIKAIRLGDFGPDIALNGMFNICVDTVPTYKQLKKAINKARKKQRKK